MPRNSRGDCSNKGKATGTTARLRERCEKQDCDRRGRGHNELLFALLNNARSGTPYHLTFSACREWLFMAAFMSVYQHMHKCSRSQKSDYLS
ncbi:hypothetical protein GOP47_0029942 [Adiantum capillus-veneris]|nr:hypothetical protein GOP47_0029942 [Adiantum capillus-veneris]